jgi:uncharacterized membrane-anchored protein
MSAARYALAIVSVFLLGSAAGSFAHHKEGSSYAVPIMLAVLGIAAAVAAWKSGKK